MSSKLVRPKIFMDIVIAAAKKAPVKGHVVMDLYADKVPKTTFLFVCLCFSGLVATATLLIFLVRQAVSLQARVFLVDSCNL